MNIEKSIVMTGFMGSGKSAVGREVAALCSLPFTDLDKKIEKEEGCSIASIFAKRGESYFRSLEHEYLLRYLKGPVGVLALGGGALEQEKVRSQILESGLLVYLRVSEQELYRRLKRDRNRPMIRDAHGQLLSDPELFERIRNLLDKREPMYLTAPVQVEVDQKWSVRRTAEQVIQQIRAYLS